MHFLYPGFLLALLALAIPIIVHLFNFRRFKKIYFTNVRFLREIKQDTQSRSRLRHLLILISRILAVTFLVFAFAQPYIPVSNKRIETGRKRISVYIDNSFSMDAQGKTGSLFETARKKAREIASAYKPSDQFQLLTTDFEAKHQRLVSRDEFYALLDEIKPGTSARTISEILSRQHDALSSGDEKTSKRAYLISDFQRTIADEIPNSDSAMQISFVPVEASRQNNLYIDTCVLSTPFIQLNRPNDLTVKIRNRGEADAENIPVKLMINGTQKAIASVTIAAGASGDAKLNFTLTEAGWQAAAISISDYPVTFDDNFYFSFNVRPRLDILCVNQNQPAPALNAVFGNDEYFKVRNSPVGQIDYSLFPSSQLIILNELNSFSSGMIHEVSEYVNKGGSVFLIPSDNADIASYSELMNEIGLEPFTRKITAPDKVISINDKNTLFADVFEKGKKLPENMDLPVINSYFEFARITKNSSQPVMKMQSGNTYLLASKAGRGSAYAIASSLQPESGSFPRHALFVPVVLRAALQGSSEVRAPLIIGRDHEFVVNDTLIANDNVFHLSNLPLKFDIIPESRLLNDNMVISVHDQINTAQNYELKTADRLISLISFDYDRKESDLAVLNHDELEKLAAQSGSNFNVIDKEAKDLSHTITQANEGKRLWKTCIILALLFLAAEILLIRYFNRKSLKPAS
jgi:hypothetical protein